jgi:hypothetical protein
MTNAYAVHSINERANTFGVLKEIEEMRMRIEYPLKLVVIFSRGLVMCEHDRLRRRLVQPLRKRRYATRILYV